MDTVVEVTCVHNDKTKAHYAISKAFSEIERIEDLFSKFKDKSEISKINSKAGSGKVKISKEVFFLIKRSIYYSEFSHGAFDITLEKEGYKNIILDEKDYTIHFSDPNIKIDLGGIAKGYSVDKAKDILVSNDIKSGMVNVGGNIYALGTPPRKNAWDIGVRDPRHKTRIIQKIKLKNEAVSTSGNYERPNHIIDPKTGDTPRQFMSVTVIAPLAEEADALSTALFVMPSHKGLDLKGVKVFIVNDRNND